MNAFHRTPLLHGLGTTGEKVQWQGFAARDGAVTVIYTEFGRVGGTIQRSKPSVVKAKNVGRANETTLEDQARSEIDSKCLKKQKEGYVPQGVERSAAIARHQERVLPMLAPTKVFPAHARSLRWPLFVQPKLDGMRLVTDGTDFWSRKGELQKEENIRHLRHDTKGLLVDGEVLLPWSDHSFQESMEAIKNPKHPLRNKLVYCVFDIVDLERTFEERLAVLTAYMEANPHPSWLLVTTGLVRDEAAAREFFLSCVGKGLEGCMLRNAHGKYRPKARSMDLQKYKPTDDDEFEIVGYEEANGNWAGTPVLKLVTSAANGPAQDGSSCRPGVEFSAKPKMALADARRLWEVRDSLVGKKATVLFQGYYDQKEDKADAGKPRFPRVKAIRDYE